MILLITSTEFSVLVFLRTNLTSNLENSIINSNINKKEEFILMFEFIVSAKRDRISLYALFMI